MHLFTGDPRIGAGWEEKGGRRRLKDEQGKGSVVTFSGPRGLESQFSCWALKFLGEDTE